MTPSAPSAATPAVKVAAAQPTATPQPGSPVGKFQVPGPIQTVGPWPTAPSFTYPTIGPFQVPGPIQTVGPWPTLAPYTWPTIGPIQVPGPFPTVNALPTRQKTFAVVPASAKCLSDARIRALGTFTARSFELEIPKSEGVCQVPAGMFMRSQEGLQDMLVMATEDVKFAGGSTKTMIYANCMDVSKHGPKEGSLYKIGGMVAPESDLGKIVAAVPAVPPNQLTVVGLQAAVWSVTNNVTRDHLGRIFQVESADLASAKTILEKAGVSTADKALFK
ncbi:MAG: hypothetical protein U0821_07370 [Chloroflexota bacterium]